MSVEMIYVQSRSIEQVGYDAANEELYVRFLKSDTTYVYTGVPPFIYEEFITSSSLGSYHNANLKNVYPYRKE